MTRAAACALALVAAALAVPAQAPAAEPALSTAPARLAAALRCYGTIGPKARPPIVVAPGTGSDGAQVHVLGGPAFASLGHPYCVVSFPDHATADLQLSVEYLVAAIRTASSRAGQPVTVFGIGEGGLLARLALTGWPTLRARVADVVSVSAPQHGGPPAPACATAGCPAASWQQARGSALLRALDDGRDETPGRTTDWTTVRSSADEVVRPLTGSHPTSALSGAANVLIQAVCPGRTTTHLATAVDSVTLAVLRDAVGHRGPVRVSRLPAGVCGHRYADGLDTSRTARSLTSASKVILRHESSAPVVGSEPPVRSWLTGSAARAPVPPAAPPSPPAAPAPPPAGPVAPVVPVVAPLPPAGPDGAFTDSYSAYKPFAPSADQCVGTEPVYGYEPPAAGRYPVLIYLHGSNADLVGNLEGRAVAALAAAQGFLAAAVTYDSSLTGYYVPYMDAQSRCIFSAGAPGNALARICARPKADCSQGIVVSGFSQGGVIAGLAANHSALVRAAWVMGVNSTPEPALLAAPGGSRALPDDRLRITIGRGDVTSLDALNALTGQRCASSPCLRPDGSGYDVVEHAQVADKFADHCFWQSVSSSTPASFPSSCASPPTFDPGFLGPDTIPWSLPASLEWLRTKLGSAGADRAAP